MPGPSQLNPDECSNDHDSSLCALCQESHGNETLSKCHLKGYHSIMSALYDLEMEDSFIRNVQKSWEEKELKVHASCRTKLLIKIKERTRKRTGKLLWTCMIQ